MFCIHRDENKLLRVLVTAEYEELAVYYKNKDFIRVSNTLKVTTHFYLNTYLILVVENLFYITR